MPVQIKRIYEQVSEKDGYRVLVDKVWPRGVSKERAKLDEWAKEITPTPELRKWFNHEKDKFIVFAEEYKKELQSNKEGRQKLNELTNIAVDKEVTLVFAAKDEKYNHAVLLQQWMEEKLEKE
ncbi:uncharacterized protein YeaO (DUF488 family) [Salibacterium salarium]|uniref:DUF488 domain-containing protein n=1 Tax=Salibacterium salarium TaxID=284579 RepID=UPI00277F1F7B|nr:DUF488 family protein [Salibacterium salarium]MDQ0298629.1 uncharacterized protein YeaO (DUF488 family) [Salibacterium salarium]